MVTLHALPLPDEGGRSVSEIAQQLHLLIDSDPHMASHLWRASPAASRPFLLCNNPLARSIGDVLTPGGYPYRIGAALDDLLQETLYGGPGTAEEELYSSMADVRDHFGLRAGDRIRLALAGSHSSISASFDAVQFHDGTNADRRGRSPLEAASRRGRMLAGLLEETFAMLEPFEAVWLTEAFPVLRPTVRFGRYEGLAALARAELEMLELPPFGNVGRQLKRPAVPRIYVSEQEGDEDTVEWRLLRPADRNHPYSVTQRLLDQFGRERYRNSRLRGVLVKLLPQDISDQNPFDAPVVGQTTIESAQRLGIEAILLDARCGVLRLAMPEAVNPELVFGNLPPD